jgi:hypothetical protein
MKILLLTLLVLQAPHLASKPLRSDACLECHDNIQPTQFGSHQGLACVRCHAGIQALPHDEKVPPVECSKCHAHEVEDYKSSVHGLASLKGAAHAATCSSCHGPAHAIVSPRNPRSKVAKRHMMETCGACHAKAFLEQLHTRLPHRASRMMLKPVPKESKP